MNKTEVVCVREEVCVEKVAKMSGGPLSTMKEISQLFLLQSSPLPPIQIKQDKLFRGGQATARNSKHRTFYAQVMYVT